MLQKWPKFLDAPSTQRFLTEAPRPTVWWLERAVSILAHATTPDCSRRSFGSWLIPEMLREVLRLDSIAGFTAADLDAMLQLQGDQVVAAWRQTERVEDDWAGALAQAAGCSKGWVYERRKKLLAKYKIDLATPFAFYRDLIFFGPNSLTKPKVRAALNAALARGDAATNLRLRQQAVKDFDRRRIDVVGATVRAPPLLMSPKVAIDRTVAAHDQLDAERGLQSVAPREPDEDGATVRGSAVSQGNSPGALNLRGGTHGAARGQDVDVRPAAPARPVAKPAARHQEGRPVRLHRPVEPPPTENRVRLHLIRRPPPPPPKRRRVRLHAIRRPPPHQPTETKKVRLHAMR